MFTGEGLIGQNLLELRTPPSFVCFFFGGVVHHAKRYAGQARAPLRLKGFILAHSMRESRAPVVYNTKT